MAAVTRELVGRGLPVLAPFTARPPTEPVSFGALATVPDPFPTSFPAPLSPPFPREDQE
jgi:sarcosine oxidase subunit beta